MRTQGPRAASHVSPNTLRRRVCQRYRFNTLPQAPSAATPLTRDEALAAFLAAERRKKEIPYIEGNMKDVGARVGYTVLYF